MAAPHYTRVLPFHPPFFPILVFSELIPLWEPFDLSLTLLTSLPFLVLMGYGQFIKLSTFQTSAQKLDVLEDNQLTKSRPISFSML